MIQVVADEAKALEQLKVHVGGTYVTMEGPQFSTRAESELYRSWGAKIIGMTNGTEAKLAREAGMGFCTIAMVTDYDCWHPSHDDVDVKLIIQTAMSNSKKVRDLLLCCLEPLAALGPSEWREALSGSVMTPKEFWTPEAIAKTEALFDHIPVAG